MTSLHIGSERAEFEDILILLALSSCGVNARNKLGRTALHLAAKQGNLENLRILLDAGCDRNIKDKLGFTAVGLAFKFNQKASADILLHYKPRRNQTVCEATVHYETLSKEATCENSRAKFDGITPLFTSKDLCDKTLLKLTDCASNRKALSLKIYNLILTILTQKRNTLDGMASSKSRKTIKPVETIFERQLLNLILTSTSFIQYPLNSYTVTRPDDKYLCGLKPRAIERDISFLSSLESGVLKKLLQGLRDTLRSSPKPPGSASKSDRSLISPFNWKLEENEAKTFLQGFKTFAQLLVKVCRGQRAPKSTSVNLCDSKSLATPFHITALQNACEQKLTDIEMKAVDGSVLKLNKVLTALVDSQKPKAGFYDLEKSCVADNVENCLSCLDHVLNTKSISAPFAQDVLETFIQFPNIFIFCLKQKDSLFSALVTKLLLDEGTWMADKIAKIFLQICVALMSDQRLLLTCAGTVMKLGLSQHRSNAVALGTRFLVRMGLLKQEDKADIVKDLKGPLFALEHLFTKEYFPRDLAAIFASFLCKSSPRLFGLDQLRLRALASAVTKEILPTSAHEPGSDVGKRFKRICDIVAVEGDCELLVKCVDPLFSRAFVTLKCDVWPIGESILVYLGLLKSEFHIETVRNLGCALKVLQHAVKQSYFPSLLKQLFVCFLQKPNASLTPYSREVDEILSSLTNAIAN